VLVDVLVVELALVVVIVEELVLVDVAVETVVLVGGLHCPFKAVP